MSLYTSRVLAACSKGDIAYLHRISKETSLSSCLDKFGASPVHYAVRSGKRDCLQWLVMVGGLSPRTPAHNGAMPVHDAAATGQLECLEWLVRKGGCDADARDCAQATPLHLAARFGHISIVEWLVVEEQCSPMERAQNGATPVHLAAAKGSTNCLKWLTKKEPRSVNLCSETGTSPAYLAAQEGRLQCLQHLVREAGADPRLKAADGMTPVHAAAQMGRTDCLAFLVREAGMSVSEKDNDGATPLHFASARGHIPVILWLLDHGAQACADNFGNTPLHDAAEHGQVQSIRILLDHGADPTIKDKEGFTPAELARECGHLQAAAFLAKYRPPQRNETEQFAAIAAIQPLTGIKQFEEMDDLQHVLVTPGQPTSEQHSDSTRGSPSSPPQGNAASLIREPQVQDTDSSPTGYNHCNVSTGSSSPDWLTASPSGDKHRDLYSLNHPQMQQRQRHNSWAGLHPSRQPPPTAAAPVRTAHSQSPQPAVQSASRQAERPVSLLPQWKMELWVKRGQRCERRTGEHTKEDASNGLLEVPPWKGVHSEQRRLSSPVSPLRVPHWHPQLLPTPLIPCPSPSHPAPPSPNTYKSKGAWVEKEKQAQENRLKLEALPQWKKELFLKSHVGLLK